MPVFSAGIHGGGGTLGQDPSSEVLFGKGSLRRPANPRQGRPVSTQ